MNNNTKDDDWPKINEIILVGNKDLKKKKQRQTTEILGMLGQRRVYEIHIHKIIKKTKIFAKELVGPKRSGSTAEQKNFYSYKIK